MFAVSHLPFYIITIFILIEPDGSWAEHKTLQRLRSSLYNTADAIVDTISLIVANNENQKTDDVQNRFGPNFGPVEPNPGLWSQLMGMFQNQFNQYSPWLGNSAYNNRRTMESDDYVPSISSPASSPRMKNRVKSMRVLHHENFIPPPVERV